MNGRSTIACASGASSVNVVRSGCARVSPDPTASVVLTLGVADEAKVRQGAGSSAACVILVTFGSGLVYLFVRTAAGWGGCPCWQVHREGGTSVVVRVVLMAVAHGPACGDRLDGLDRFGCSAP